MCKSFLTIGVLSLILLIAGCQLGPDPKLGLYVQGQNQAPSGMFLDGYSTEHRLPVGLLVLNDTTEKNSPPPMTLESITALTKQLSYQIEAQFPIQVAQLVKTPPTLSGHTLPFAQLGKEAGVNYLVIAILSSHEVESPQQLPLGGVIQGGAGRGWLLGSETENFSLAEIAVVEVNNGQTLFQSSGQGYATLNRLYVPVESNVYPVIYGAQRQPPIYPKEEFQYDVLRSVSAHQAIDQAMLHLKRPGNARMKS